jgi:hypothetical protein
MPLAAGVPSGANRGRKNTVVRLALEPTLRSGGRPRKQ